MNNLVILQGVASQVEVDFDAFDRKYCNFKLAIARKSGIMDILNCEIHSDSEFFTNGNYVRITGRVRCRGIRMGGKIECDMYVECDDVEVTTQWDDTNNVYLSGTLSKVGDLRLTPQSHREIIDFAVRVNNGGIEYIQCIAWGKCARKIANKKRGDKASFVGRFQSRDYVKRLGNNEEELRTAYEVSCNYILKEGNSNETEIIKYDSGKLYVLCKRTI